MCWLGSALPVHSLPSLALRQSGKSCEVVRKTLSVLSGVRQGRGSRDFPKIVLATRMIWFGGKSKFCVNLTSSV